MGAIEIRRIHGKDQGFLFDMLYQSLYVEPGKPKLDPTIVEEPQISRYVENWGRPGDFGLLAINDHEIRMGAVWLRYFEKDNKGYGFIHETIPEIGIAVDENFRGRGVGTTLLRELLARTKNHIESISLSVQSSNPAKKLYERFGFYQHSRSGDSIVMRYDR